MDKIEDIAKQASQLTFYDLKSYYNQAKNMVLNVSEMEAKVREATNEDPWGASSTLMQEIAQGTQSFQHFNEIMPTIYSRFMEKEAREWRQIYKALTLLEYLVKHGSERVVDDARSHISTVKMLKSFHYIDEKGKDQGINVRNRAKEIADLLADVERIRQERRKAKANRSKYSGTGNDGAAMSFASSGSRYGGFGSETLGGGGGGGYEPDSEYRRGGSSSQRPASFDEYEGADDFDEQPRRTNSTASRPPKPVAKTAEPPQPKAKQPEVDLFSFGDDEPVAAPAAHVSAPLASLDDDFDDFQEAPSFAPSKPAAAPLAASTVNSALFDLLDSNPPQVAARAAPPTYTSTPFASAQPLQPQSQRAPAPAPAPSPAAAPKPSGASGFDDLWLGAFGGEAPKPATNAKTIKDLEKEKAMASLWGPSKPAASAPAPAPAKGGFDDLLL